MPDIRTTAEPGKLTKLSTQKVRTLPQFAGKQIVRYYIAISTRVINGVFGIHLQSNIDKSKFPLFLTKSFTTKSGQHITVRDKVPGSQILIDGQPFNSGESFSIFVCV